MAHKILILSFFWVICGIFVPLLSQKYLQIEIPNQVETIRYKEGDRIKYRIAEYGEEWQSGKIKSILVDENVIVFDNEFVHVGQFTHIKERLPIRYIAGSVLFTFGAAWLLYGGVALVLSLPGVVPKDLIVGAVALTAGYIFRIFSNKTYTMGHNARIRLIDITFPIPNKP